MLPWLAAHWLTIAISLAPSLVTLIYRIAEQPAWAAKNPRLDAVILAAEALFPSPQDFVAALAKLRIPPGGAVVILFLAGGACGASQQRAEAVVAADAACLIEHAELPPDQAELACLVGRVAASAMPSGSASK